MTSPPATLTAVLLACSCVELVACFGLGDAVPRGYALAVGLVSALCTCAIDYARHQQAAFLSRSVISLPNLDLDASALLTALVFAWWAAAAFNLTFRPGPFHTLRTANGYLSTWGATIASLLLLDAKLATRQPGSPSPHLPLAGLIIASLCVFFGSTQSPMHSWECILCLIISVLSLATCLLLLVPAARAKLEEKTGPMLQGRKLWHLVVAMWCVECLIGTFRKPFAEAQNGFFASWAALFCAFRVSANHQLYSDDGESRSPFASSPVEITELVSPEPESLKSRLAGSAAEPGEAGRARGGAFDDPEQEFEDAREEVASSVFSREEQLRKPPPVDDEEL